MILEDEQQAANIIRVLFKLRVVDDLDVYGIIDQLQIRMVKRMYP